MSTGKRMPLFYAFMLRFNTILAIAAWPLFLLVAFTQDWTVIFVPLLISAGVGMMWLSLRKQYGSPRQVRPTPDYSLIARMEREVWGETFGHEGAPASPATLTQDFAADHTNRDHCWMCEDRHRMQNLAALYRTKHDPETKGEQE